MADVRRVVELVFGATDNASRTINEVGRSVSTVSFGVQQLTGPLASLADTFLLVEGAAVVAAVAMGTIAVQTGVSMLSTALVVSAVARRAD